MKITGRAYREGGFHITGSEQNRAMQNIEGVHIFTNSRAWDKTWRTYMEGVIPSPAAFPVII